MQKNIRQRKITEKEDKKEKKKKIKKEKILITKERAKEHRKRITSGETSSPRPVKK